MRTYWTASFFLSLLLAISGGGPRRAAAAIDPETAIWFSNPATNFTASLPLGNGRLGAMLFGGVEQDRVILNESSVWSGSPQVADRTDAAKYLPEIQSLLRAGKNAEAEALVNAHFTCLGPGSGGGQYGCYQVLGNLYLDFSGATNEVVTGYRRELDLATATARVEYDRGGVHYIREAFASQPAEAIVVRLTADRGGKISLGIRLDRPERFATVAIDRNNLLMTGELDNGTDGHGVKYAARVRVLAKGGRSDPAVQALRIREADEVTLIITAATDYRGFAGRQLTDPVAVSGEDLDAAAQRAYGTLLKEHVADHRKYFDRVVLHLPALNADEAWQPTPERLRFAQAHGGDPGLAALYFNFGRYLLISSSRPGGLPPNLQGIWAEEVRTPWNGDWHLDVNVQMNYWPAEVCHLPELTTPLFALIQSLQIPGERTAQA
ncbi:MAG TPA: glycoside hydrolase family 95 protein, partial [Verrucomicrobiae bacterium]